MAYIRFFVTLIWIFDILNFPQFEWLDTTFPVNFLGWLLIFMALGGVEEVYFKKEK